MTKAVLEAGAERRRGVAASVPSTTVGVPTTLQASLMARLDRLGPAAKEIAEIGVAIGREFSYELAAAVSEVSEERLQEALRRLVDAGLVFHRGMPPSAEYLFKHALVQDTAYGMLMALVSIARDTGVFARALRHARELAALDPADSAARPGLGSREKGSSVAAFSGVATSSSAWPPEVGRHRYPLIGIVIEGALWPKLDCQGTSHPQIRFR